jgi:hypothetical protein
MDETSIEDHDTEEHPERFLILLDARETQPVERLGEDGKMDFPFLSLFGKPEGILIDFVPSEANQEQELAVSRDVLKHLWPVLTHYVYTGEWCNSAEVSGDKIHLQLDPFQRELLLQALDRLKKDERTRHGCANLYTDRVAEQKRSAASARIQEIQVLELAIELAGSPAEELGDEFASCAALDAGLEA